MNLILFIPDEQRAESVSCYGHPLVRMPNYDRLAAEGVRFDQCHVSHTVCSPSRCALMTGWYPHTAGHRTLWHLLRPHEPSLFGYLRQAGYHIEWHGKNDLYAPECFDTCVDRYARADGGYAGPNPYPSGDPAHFSFLYEPFPGGLDDTCDMRDVEAGLAFLRTRRPGDPPFFLHLPLIMPHPPYASPEPFHSMYRPEDVPPLRPAGLKGKPSFHDLIRAYRGLNRLPDGYMERVQAAYLGMNGYVDWMLGRLLDVLDETGLASETTVIATSDHGDWAGDYGLVEKWPSGLDDCLTRVPLIIRSPGNRAGHVVQEPVELFDVMATALDLAGVKAQHTHFARSLVPQLGGAPGDSDRAVFAEGGYDAHEPHCFEGRWTVNDVPGSPDHTYYPKAIQQQEHPDSVCRAAMIRTQAFKLVRRAADTCELYDLRADPGELHNVYGDARYAPVRGDLELRLLDWYLHTADAVPFDENPRGLPGY